MARKKNGKLPFVVQPRLKPLLEVIGTEDAGKIEIERRGYLTVGEKAFVQAVSASEGSVSDLFSFVQKIASSTEQTSEQVLSDIRGGVTAEYLKPYHEELSAKMMAMTAYQERYRLVAATALIMSRVDASWSAEESMELHPDLLDGLANLYEEEERKCLDAFASKVVEKTEKTEGKD